jgi:tubulin-folding cofactor B
MLGFYSVISGMEIHVVDTDPFSLSRGGGLTDTSLIQKYTMSDEKYDERKGTLREFIKEKRKQDPTYKFLPPNKATTVKTTQKGFINNDETTTPLSTDKDSVAHITVGARCKVSPGERRGEVKFVGELPQIKAGGYWVIILTLNNNINNNNNNFLLYNIA